VVVGFAPGLALAVLAGGVRMPAIPVAAAPAEEQLAEEQLAENQPIDRAGSAPGPNAFLPAPLQPRPVVPVYPRKQARH
jgi:hypothetical protein